jgi:hypothetical protein
MFTVFSHTECSLALENCSLSALSRPRGNANMAQTGNGKVAASFFASPQMGLMGMFHELLYGLIPCLADWLIYGFHMGYIIYI